LTTWLGFDHHDAYDGRTQQSKNYTIDEIKTYRNKLYEEIERNQPKDTTNEQTPDSSYDAGPRVKIVRDELGLKISQFVELLSLGSQREYKAMENGNKEVPLSLLNGISEISGVNIEWLKHEEHPRYTVEVIYLNPIEADLEYCASLHPEEYFLILDKKALHIGLVAQTSKYSYKVFDTGVKLDFWNWVDEHWAIPAFYNFLQKLSDSWHDIDGVVIPANIYKKLWEGEIHFLTALSHKDHRGGDLLYDILDIDETRTGLTSYYQRYGGNWMHRVHEELKKHLSAQLAKK
jgi:hypothetical protein